MSASAAGISVRALCMVEELADAKIAGGRTGLGQEVSSVTVISTLAAAESVRPGAFVIVAPGAVGSVGAVVDMLMRAARANGAAALLVPKTATAVSSTVRLADKMGMPLLVAEVSDPLRLAQQLDRVVNAPELGRAEVLNHLARRLYKDPVTPERVVAILTGLLSARTALLGPDGGVIAGENLALPRFVADAPRTAWNGPVRVSGGSGRELVVVPITLGGGPQPVLWLVVDLPAGPREQIQSAEDASLVASWALVAWVAARRLEAERDARERTQLLSAMMDISGSIDRHLAKRVLRAGWQLEGWHTGIFFRMAEPSGGSLVRYTELVQAALSAHELSGPLVERAMGWAMWLTNAQEPPATSYRTTVRRVQAALSAFGDDLVLMVGVGRPCAGAEGIALTLQEAYRASLLAGTGSPRTRVVHIDELGLERLLADWYTSESFQAYAGKLLEPLGGSSGDTLLRTLETYLEHESSTTTTASALGVHRNTVADRIARVERLLGVDLSASDDRLVVQLACRTHRLGTAEEAAAGAAGGASDEVSAAGPTDTGAARISRASSRM